MSSPQSWWRGAGTPAQTQAESSSYQPEPVQIPEDDSNERLPTRRIHILGLGSIGTFIAHSLRCLPNPPPIVLMLHKAEMYEQFKTRGRVIRLVDKKSGINDEQYGYDIEFMRPDTRLGRPFWETFPHLENMPQVGASDGKASKVASKDSSEEGRKLPSGETYIQTIIVTVKGPATRTALSSIKHRVDSKTTICLVQNGMGQVEELNREVFTDPDSRPTYILGIISHGVHLTSPFIAQHAGFGTTALAIVRDFEKFPRPPKTSSPNLADLSAEDKKRLYPSTKDLYGNVSSRYLLRTLTRSPILACAAFPYLDLMQLQVEKLAMNAVLNPLTALLDVPNGSMLENNPLSKVQRLLIAEISMVLRGLPEFEGVPNILARFSPQRLETLFFGVSQKTALNSSSMREDMRKGRNTEIDYINGYIVKRGEEQGIKCVLNYMIMQLVKSKSFIQNLEPPVVRPYGTSMLRGTLEEGREGEALRVTLEDAGTPAKGQPA